MENVTVTKKTPQTSGENDLHAQMVQPPPRTTPQGNGVSRSRGISETGGFRLLCAQVTYQPQELLNVEQTWQNFPAEENLSFS